MEEKIAKLLAMAEGTNNPHEAEVFMAKAEQLMLAYGIERATLEAKQPGGRKTINIETKRIYIKNGHGYAAAMLEIGFQIADSFSVRALQSTHSDGSRTLWLIGHSNDVDDATQLFNSLMVQSRQQAIYWWRTEGKVNNPYATDNDAYLARREFIYAFGRGAGSRLRETRNRAVVDAGAGTELVLVDRKKAVDTWIDENMKVGVARQTSRRGGGGDARAAGYRSGQESVSQKPLKG